MSDEDDRNVLNAGIKKVEMEALADADAWLKLLDEGKLTESYDAASGFLKGKVSNDKWKTDIAEAIKPYGKIAARRNLGCMFSTRLPGMPDGDYVMLHFECVHSSGKTAVENVTMLLEDGKWKAAGYYIAPVGLMGMSGKAPSPDKSKTPAK
ncbi:MAG: DUF4019 domain-containing protein [Lentisphaerota bacterium]